MSDTVSQDELKGGELIDELVRLVGLPGDSVQNELERMVEVSGHSQENLTLDELRSVLVNYLETLALEAEASGPVS